MEASKPIAKKSNDDLQFSQFIRGVVMHAVYFLLGVIISRGAVLGELSPFGAAFSASVQRRFTGTAVAGCVLGYILLSPSDAFRYIAVVLAIGALRWLFSDLGKITKSALFAPAVTFATMISTGIALLYVSTSRMTEFGICLVEALISSAAAYFISRSSQLMSSSRGLTSFNQQEIACLTVSVCILMLSFASLNIFGVSVGRLLSVVVVLLCAKYGGVAGGSISGIATGVVFSLGSVDMTFLSGGYAFGGLVAGVFSVMGKLPVGAAFTICNTVLSFASPERELVFTLFIECMLATGLFMLIPGDFGNTIRAAFTSAPDRNQSDAMRRNITARLDYAAHALDGVNECITAVSEKLGRRCGSDTDMQIYENAVSNTCCACGLKVYCWDKQKELTKDDFSRLTEVLRTEGFVSEKDVSEKFMKKCCKERELAANINLSYREYLSSLAAQRRITQVRSVVASQFSGLSDMLWDLADEFEDCENYDVDSADKITELLRQEGVVVIECSCRIDKHRGMAVELELALGRKEDIDRNMVQGIVSNCCGRRFERASISTSGDRMRLTMCEISDYDAEIGTSQHISENGNLCGDCLTYFMNGTGSMVVVISDGMGSGGAAAVDSNMAVAILKKLLKAGLTYDCALSVVNSSLMIKSEEESMATLDVADINLFSGKVSFYKAGAPVTYVRKCGRVHRREFPSLPVGILNEVKFAKDTVSLHEGDVMLMVSDGAITGDDKWLEELVRTWNEASCQDFASLVVNEAMKRRQNTHDDDITAIAVRLTENG